LLSCFKVLSIPYNTSDTRHDGLDADTAGDINTTPLPNCIQLMRVFKPTKQEYYRSSNNKWVVLWWNGKTPKQHCIRMSDSLSNQIVRPFELQVADAEPCAITDDSWSQTQGLVDLANQHVPTVMPDVPFQFDVDTLRPKKSTYFRLTCAIRDGRALKYLHWPPGLNQGFRFRVCKRHHNVIGLRLLTHSTA
jgi:hypothetical protein